MKQSDNKSRMRSHLKLMGFYLLFCFSIIFVSIQSLKKLIEQNNITQMNTTIGLMAEKMNNSIQIMSGYVQIISDMLSARELTDIEQYYEELQNSIGNLPFTSIGILSSTGTVYGSPGEKADMEKYDFLQTAAVSEEIYITEPYRSSTTGNNIITMFHPFYHDGVRLGSVFVSYPLEEIQVLANTSILRDETEIFLMNAFSGNFIRCSDSGGMPSGSWNNIKLIKRQIAGESGYDYDTWEQGMRDGRQNDVIFLKIDGVSYTQAYENIDSMDGWYVIVRIPNSSLANVMQEYSRGTSIGIFLMVIATLVVISILFHEELSEKKRLQQLSKVDPLTQTMNRRAFQELIQQFFLDDHEKKKGVLMFLDLDSFKHINDTYGHAAGDQLLHHFAASLQSIFRKDCLIARIGGDEFIVFLKNPPGRDAIGVMMEQLKQSLVSIHLKDCDNLTVRYSAGLAQYPEDAQDLESLKKAADKALYYVKGTTKDAYCWYSMIPGAEISAEKEDVSGNS